MIEEQFSIGDSFVHNLDPRVKIIVAIIFSVVVAVSSNFSALLPALVVAVTVTRKWVDSLPLVLSSLYLSRGYLVYCWTIGWNKTGCIVCQPDYAQI
jgi:cobalt/nickel transport system permease protein